ncbi:CinA family protein [Agromyces soli]|uniref:CinA family protein n=1 Tax=Agromyces soli TaxID=659012 RepID=A0ABY4AXD5_9MICO|nr:CinA family protein [Agromyces soli]UOE27867.1 CinA family protein [Agromyces soli]
MPERNGTDGEIERLAQEVAVEAGRRGLRIGAAESLTSGAIAVALGKADDASEWFAGSIVAYEASVKFELLGVTPGPVVTARAAEQMATGARERLGADAAVAVTGVGGPGEEEGRPAGTVYVAAALGDRVHVGEHHFDGDPAEVVAATVRAALAALLERLRSA